MSAEFMDALNAVVERFKELAIEDSALRSRLRALAHAVLAVTDQPESAPVQAPERVFATPAPAVTSDTIRFPDEIMEAIDEELHADEAVPPTNKSVVESAAWPARWLPITNADLPIIATRCRLKAEAIRWIVERYRLRKEGVGYAELAPTEKDLIARAKATDDCFLWMIQLNEPSPANPTPFENVAGCFDALADAATVTEALVNEGSAEQFQIAAQLVAEAQSALRVAVGRIYDRVDTDQSQSFTWLKGTTEERHIYVERYMKLEDAADPAIWADLRGRIKTLDSQLQEVRQHDQQQRKRFGKVRYVAGVISSGGKGHDLQRQWRTLATTVDELVNSGMPPSNRDLRELLLPILDLVPNLDEPAPGFQRALQECERFQATIQEAPEQRAEAKPAAEVQEAARLLQGRMLVMIGGECRDYAQVALTNALRLKGVSWIETKEHQSIESFENEIALPDVAVVVLAIRWSSHSFADVKMFCDKHGKPFVRLPAGYNPNQVAAQILAQCGEKLRSSLVEA